VLWEDDVMTHRIETNEIIKGNFGEKTRKFFGSPIGKMAVVATFVVTFTMNMACNWFGGNSKSTEPELENAKITFTYTNDAPELAADSAKFVIDPNDAQINKVGFTINDRPPEEFEYDENTHEGTARFNHFPTDTGDVIFEAAAETDMGTVTKSVSRASVFTLEEVTSGINSSADTIGIDLSGIDSVYLDSIFIHIIPVVPDTSEPNPGAVVSIMNSAGIEFSNIFIEEGDCRAVYKIVDEFGETIASFALSILSIDGDTVEWRLDAIKPREM